ncbi:MAG: 50S ribosomal protein L11 methyltransferase [Thermodesulfobacteriota bacterium]
MGSARPKTWIELRATGPAASGDIASALFIEAGSPGVSEGFTRPAGDVVLAASPAEEVEPSAGGRGGEAELTAYLPEAAGAELEGLSAKLSPLGWSFTVSTYVDVDWSVKWRAGLRPVRVSAHGRTLLIKPAWSRARPGPGTIEVIIDPSMAFGTGTHATTKLCLRAIMRILHGGGRAPAGEVLDVGCGTGVLAIAAVKLGAVRAVGVDIDPVALRVARANVRKNGARVTISSLPAERVRGRFSLVAANILSGELLRLAPALFRKVRPGGRLVLSGILDGEAERVGAAYGALGLRRVKTLTSSGWAAMIFEKDPGS